jgi:hypothetical protein
VWGIFERGIRKEKGVRQQKGGIFWCHMMTKHKKCFIVFDPREFSGRDVEDTKKYTTLKKGGFYRTSSRRRSRGR